MAIVQHLIVDEYGSFIAKKSERLQVTCKGEKRQEAPIMHLETVLVTGGGISFSSDAVAACAEAGIPIHFLDKRGHPVGSFYSAGLAATVQTRRAQLTARTDRRGRDFGLAVVGGKLRNQINLLKYMAKYRKERQPEVYEAVRLLADGMLDNVAELDRLGSGEADEGEAGEGTIDACRGQLLSIEGRAAQKYWAGVAKLLNPEVAWPGRERQGATDPFNSALNYGYGILYSQVERSLVLAGLDPYAGFIHVDRPGTPSLVLDMVEEFRQTVVDRTVMAIFNRGTAVTLDERGRLVEESRKGLAEKVLARLNAVEAYDGKRFSLTAIIQSQARRAAAFYRGEKDAYVAHVSAW